MWFAQTMGRVKPRASFLGKLGLEILGVQAGMQVRRPAIQQIRNLRYN